MNISDFWFYFKTRLKGKSLDNPIITTKTTQENPRDAQAVKSFNKSFDAQQQQMQVRVLKPHDPKCEDVWMCKRRKCFRRTPDKIIGESTTVSVDSVKQDMKTRMNIKKAVKNDSSKLA